jgi:hypothetical protein
MSMVPELIDDFSPPEEIVQAGLNGDLILFVGAGASMLLGLPSWNGLAMKVLEDLCQAGYLNYSELEQLQMLDAKKQLSIAQLIAKDKSYDLKINRYLTGVAEGDSIYKALNDIGCPCVTTNYDELLSPRYLETKDGSTTPVPVNRVSEREKFFAYLLNEPEVIMFTGRHGKVTRGSIFRAIREWPKHTR